MSGSFLRRRACAARRRRSARRPAGSRRAPSPRRRRRWPLLVPPPARPHRRPTRPPPRAAPSRPTFAGMPIATSTSSASGTSSAIGAVDARGARSHQERDDVAGQRHRRGEQMPDHGRRQHAGVRRRRRAAVDEPAAPRDPGDGEASTPPTRTATPAAAAAERTPVRTGDGRASSTAAASTTWTTCPDVRSHTTAPAPRPRDAGLAAVPDGAVHVAEHAAGQRGVEELRAVVRREGVAHRQPDPEPADQHAPAPGTADRRPAPDHHGQRRARGRRRSGARRGTVRCPAARARRRGRRAAEQGARAGARRSRLIAPPPPARPRPSPRSPASLRGGRSAGSRPRASPARRSASPSHAAQRRREAPPGRRQARGSRADARPVVPERLGHPADVGWRPPGDRGPAPR